MTALSNSVTTSSGSGDALNKAWRKIQGKVAQGYQFESEEYAMLDDLAEESAPYTLRQSGDGGENTFSVDLNEEAGVSSIPEGGYEAKPSSVGLEEARYFVSQFNARFDVSLLAMYADKGASNQVERQLELQASKKVQAISSTVSDYFYGSSSAVLATTSTTLNGASTTITLDRGYGLTNISNATAAGKAFITDKFRVNDRIAIINTSGPTLIAMGTVTARSKTAGTLTVTWDASQSSVTTSNYAVVKANSMEATTLAGTDYNRGLVGMTDWLFSSSLFSLTHANWDVAYSDTNAGRFQGVKLRRANNEIGNQGGGKVTDVFWSQGVERDSIALERASVRFGDPFGIELDGSVKSKGRTFRATRRVPPGWVVPLDKSALYKKTVLPKPDGKVSWQDGKEYINQSGMVFRVELVIGTIVKNRKKISYFLNQTES